MIEVNKNELAGAMTALGKLICRTSITVARMEVPCCGGTVMVVKKALEQAGMDIPLRTVTVGIDGTVEE